MVLMLDINKINKVIQSFFIKEEAERIDDDTTKEFVKNLADSDDEESRTLASSLINNQLNMKKYDDRWDKYYKPSELREIRKANWIKQQAKLHVEDEDTKNTIYSYLESSDAELLKLAEMILTNYLEKKYGE